MKQARKLLKIKEVKARTGLSHSTVYLLVKQGAFPKPIQLSQRCCRWVEDEIEDFIEARTAERDSA